MGLPSPGVMIASVTVTWGWVSLMGHASIQYPAVDEHPRPAKDLPLLIGATRCQYIMIDLDSNLPTHSSVN